MQVGALSEFAWSGLRASHTCCCGAGPASTSCAAGLTRGARNSALNLELSGQDGAGEPGCSRRSRQAGTGRSQPAEGTNLVGVCASAGSWSGRILVLARVVGWAQTGASQPAGKQRAPSGQRQAANGKKQQRTLLSLQPVRFPCSPVGRSFALALARIETNRKAARRQRTRTNESREERTRRTSRASERAPANLANTHCIWPRKVWRFFVPRLPLSCALACAVAPHTSQQRARPLASLPAFLPASESAQQQAGRQAIGEQRAAEAGTGPGAGSTAERCCATAGARCARSPANMALAGRRGSSLVGAARTARSPVRATHSVCSWPMPQQASERAGPHALAHAQKQQQTFETSTHRRSHKLL